MFLKSVGLAEPTQPIWVKNSQNGVAVDSDWQKNLGIKPYECLIKDLSLPKNTVIYAAGWYSGRTLNFQIDQSGDSAGQMDITVNSKNPVVLTLVRQSIFNRFY